MEAGWAAGSCLLCITEAERKRSLGLYELRGYVGVPMILRGVRDYALEEGFIRKDRELDA